MVSMTKSRPIYRPSESQQAATAPRSALTSTSNHSGLAAPAVAVTDPVTLNDVTMVAWHLWHGSRGPASVLRRRLHVTAPLDSGFVWGMVATFGKHVVLVV